MTRRRVLAGIAVALLLALAYTGIAGGIDQFDQSSHGHYTIGQIVQTVVQLLYGVLSVACIAVRFWAPGWIRPVVITWAVSLSLAGGLAPVVWGHSAIWIGILAGVASLLVAWAIVALLGKGGRREHQSPPASPGESYGRR